jgi:predicted GIY-YIG superfamily endonuclease
VAGNIASRLSSVYILQNSASGTRYVGSTTQIETRLLAHERVEHPGWEVAHVVDGLSCEVARRLERELIAAFRRAGVELGNRPNPSQHR